LVWKSDRSATRPIAIIDAFMRQRFGPRYKQLDPDQLQLGLRSSTRRITVSGGPERRRRWSTEQPL